MNEELKKLYDAIASRGFYTKSYDEFVNQYQDPAYRDKVFDVVTREGLYTKGRNEFDAKYGAAPLKKKEPSVSTSQEGAMAPATEAGSLASPKSKTVETTRADGTPVTVQFGPTEFKSSDEAPVPQFKTFSEMAGQVDATIDEPTKQKISQAIGITGAVFNKIVNPNASVPEAINQAKAFADNTQTAYNVGVLSGQISNNMQQSVPDKERIAKLNRELKQEQTKLASSQMGADASNFFDMLASNPVTFLTEVLTTSAAQMATGVGGMRPEDLAAAGALTLATGIGGTAYMSGRNSLNAEMSSRIMGALEERGVDITDAAQLETAMTNRDLMMEIAGEVQAPATFVAALDALSAGMAGKLGKPIYEVLAQSLAGSIGEAGAQLIESGEITSASAVLTEAVAELPGGLVETAFGAKTKDVQRKIEINRQLKDVEAQIERTEDEDTKSVLRSVADNLRNEKNKIYDDYAAFVNSLPEEDVARLNSLNEEIVKTSKAIDQVDNAATKDALKARRSALLKQVEQLENKQPDAVQEQATDEGVLRPEQPEVGLQEVVEGDQEPQVAAEEEVGTVGTLLNERVVYDDPVSGQPVEGDLFVDGQRVVLEAAGGQQFDLGNVDEVLAQPIDGGIVRPAEMAIMPQEDGSFVFNKDGNQKVAKGTRMVNNQPGLQAITRDDAGNVKRVTLYSEDGTETYNLTGQEAEDAAYYIVRGFVETQEGQDAINQLAERNEEARRDLTQPLGVRPVQQAAPQAAVEVRSEAPAGPVVEGAAEVDAQELADLAADMRATAPARRERLERIAERARTAVSKILPDVKIIVHDTQEAYRAATTFEGEATYNNDTKTVHINGTKATPAAVAHEVFHAVFLDKVKTDAKAQAVAKKMVESLKRVLGENSEAYQYLDEFSKDYDANLQNEEKLAEMVAVLSELYSGVNDIGLSPSAVQSVKNAIKKFITDLAKLFNIPMPTTLTDADVLAVLNTIAQKTVAGEVITEADVQTIDRVAAEEDIDGDPGIVSIRNRKEWSKEYENWASKPKSRAQILGHSYKMNHKGFVDNKINRQQFENDVRGISDRLGVAETKSKSGYYMTLDGKFFNPYKKVIEERGGDSNDLRQRMGQPNENIFDIVAMARQKGYTDKTIEIYLKQEGFAAEDIKDAMAVNSNIDGAQVPQEFGNVTGGMAQGQTLFDEIKAKLTKMAADGASMMDIRVEAQTLLMDSDVYKAQSAEVKAQLRLSLDATIGTKAADRAFRQEFKQLRAMLSDRKKARRELETIKRMMRGFIRKNLPQGEYSKAEVVALLKAIVDANVDTLPLVMEKVEGYVTGFKVRNLEGQIKKFLETKTTRVESGRLMGATTIELQEDLASLSEELANSDMSEQQMADMLKRQLIEYDKLESSYEMTEEQARRMQILDIAMMYNEAMLLENNDPNKVESLTSARNQLVAMITTGRAEFKAIKAAQHQEYNQRLRDMIEAITGESVPDDIDTKDGLDDFVRKSEVSRKNQEAVRGRIVKAWNAFFGKPVTDYFDKNGSLHTLLSRVTANLTDQFGGPVHEMVYDRLKQSGIEFERRMQMLNKMIDAKGEEIFGKDYDNVVKKNRVKQPVDVFTDKAKANRLMNEMKTASSQRKSEINLELNELRVFEPMSQNQIYYLYNQFKDVANRSGFEARFGKDYVQNLNDLFETSLDPKVKEWADWQVLELYPSVYEAYNDVYKKIFRTNMPWNPNYAGRLYREKEADDTMAITLMDEKGQFSNIQTPSSTKMRRANSNPIKIVDGDIALSSYLGDMEYFRAYGETIRDVDKLFRNKAVQESIKKVAGDDVLGMIKDQIKLVGTRGTSLGTAAKETMLDKISSRFSRAVLMANPSQFIKQATSMFAFANRIGFENWAAYTAKAAPQMGKLWNEFMDNAPRIQKRYNPRELTAIIGTYKPGRTADLMPKDKNGNPILRQAGEVYDKAIDAMMWPVVQGDKFSAMAGAMGNYLYYKEMFLQKNPSATNEQAIKFAADKVSTEIEQTLGSSDVIDRDFYQNSGNALYRAFSVLQNSPKAMIRQILPAYSGLFKKISKMDKRAGIGTLKQNLETIFMFQFFVPMLFQYAVLGFPGLLREWRDDDEEEMGMAALLGPFSALFFIGDLLTMGKDLILGKPWATEARTAPGWDLLADAGKSAKKLATADSDEEVTEALSEIAYSLSSAAGLGLKNISRLANNIAEVIDDGIDSGESVLRLLNYSDYTIEGPEER